MKVPIWTLTTFCKLCKTADGKKIIHGLDCPDYKISQILVGKKIEECGCKNFEDKK